MLSEFPMNDPKNIWQSQPTETFKMSADQLRREEQKRQTKARIEAIYTITIGIILCVAFARTFAKVHEVVPRMGWGLLSLWCIYVAYQAYRWIWPGRLAPDAEVSTWLEFYRGELERRYDYGRHLWRRTGLTFCFLGMAMVVVPWLIHWIGTPRLLLVNLGPLFVLLILWAVAFFYVRKRKQQRLRQEIEELRVLEREK